MYQLKNLKNENNIFFNSKTINITLKKSLPNSKKFFSIFSREFI